MSPFSKASLVDEYHIGMQAVAAELAQLVGNEAAASVGGLQPDQVPSVDARHYSPAQSLLESQGARLLDEAFEYGFNGRLTYWLDEWLSDDLSRWTDRFMSLSDFVSREHGGGHFDKCIRTLRIASLRDVFMPETSSVNFVRAGLITGHIHLCELALLAGIEEKTIRNFAVKGHKQYIETVKIDKRPYVKVSDALAWLERRGFAPTFLDDASNGRDLSSYPFYSRFDLARYVKLRRESLTLTVQQLANDLGTDVATLDSVEAGAAVPAADFAHRLAQVLQVPDPKAFAESASELDRTSSHIHT
jgi:hypothetical protein